MDSLIQKVGWNNQPTKCPLLNPVRFQPTKCPLRHNILYCPEIWDNIIPYMQRLQKLIIYYTKNKGARLSRNPAPYSI